MKLCRFKLFFVPTIIYSICSQTIKIRFFRAKSCFWDFFLLPWLILRLDFFRIQLHIFLYRKVLHFPVSIRGSHIFIFSGFFLPDILEIVSFKIFMPFIGVSKVISSVNPVSFTLGRKIKKKFPSRSDFWIPDQFFFSRFQILQRFF